MRMRGVKLIINYLDDIYAFVVKYKSGHGEVEKNLHYRYYEEEIY